MIRFLRSVARPATVALVFVAIAERLAGTWHRSRERGIARRRVERETLPSLYDFHPRATLATRRRLGLRTVPLDQVVGTMRRPSQNTADFLPLRQLRGRNWQGRWQRILRATDRLDVLPPIELVKVGAGYFVMDGHNRVAAARQAGALEIDADVTELRIEGETSEASPVDVGSALIGTEELRHAASGRHSRTVEHRFGGQDTMRADIPAASSDSVAGAESHRSDEEA